MASQSAAERKERDRTSDCYQKSYIVDYLDLLLRHRSWFWGTVEAVRFRTVLDFKPVICCSAEVRHSRTRLLLPQHIRSDNSPEFVAKELRQWLAKVGTGTLYIEPGSPWENGHRESFNGKLRDECSNGEIFYSLKKAQIVIEKWRVEYHTKRPHSATAACPHGL